MSDKELSEKIYYEDKDVKVTNVRITCNHLTAPVEKLGSVNVNYKMEKFSISIVLLILAASPFLFYQLFPENIKMPIAVVSMILVLAAAAFVAYVYNHYVELIVSVTGRQVALMSTNMLNKAYLENVCSKISEALLDEEKYRSLKESGELEGSLKLNPSETLRLKMVLEDYEELKKLKDEFKENKTGKKEDKAAGKEEKK